MTNGNGFNQAIADQSVQFVASTGEPPLAGSPFILDAFILQMGGEISELPAWWSRERDRFLRTRLQSNSLIAGICYGEATRVRCMPYVLTDEDDSQDRLEQYQDIFRLADFGKGFPQFCSKIALDWLTCDNGIFFEILGSGETKIVDETFYRRIIENGVQREVPYQTKFIAKGERTGEATGIAYLDSGQCWRTLNPEYPVIYTNPVTGLMTVLHWTRVYYDSAFPQGYELGRGLGLCAVSRAYETLRLVKSINLFYYEKVTGQAAEIIYANQPVSKLDQAVQAAIFQQDNAGFNVFKNTMLLAPKSGGVGAQDLKFDKIGLRDAPDGFDYKQIMDISVNILAQAFGVDVREIWAAAQTGATKADAEVQDIKTTGKGRADILSMLENAINWRVLPPELTFKFDEVDDLADKRKVEIKQIRVNTRVAQIQSGELSIQEARELAAESDDIPAEFLERIAVADDQTDVSAVNPSEQPALPEQGADESEAEQEEVAKKKTGVKQYSATRALFFNNLISFVELATTGQLSSRNFMSSMKSELRLAGRSAFLDGVRDGARNYAIGEMDLSPDEIATRDNLISTAIGYASGLRDFAYADPQPSFIQVIEKVALWSNKTLDGIYNTGKLLGSGNKMMKWRLGFTKHDQHCKTCSAAAGQIHRSSQWLRAGVVPRGDKLVCGGFKCKCELEETTERASGRLSRIPTKEIMVE